MHDRVELANLDWDAQVAQDIQRLVARGRASGAEGGFRPRRHDEDATARHRSGRGRRRVDVEIARVGGEGGHALDDRVVVLGDGRLNDKRRLTRGALHDGRRHDRVTAVVEDGDQKVKRLDLHRVDQIVQTIPDPRGVVAHERENHAQLV